MCGLAFRSVRRLAAIVACCLAGSVSPLFAQSLVWNPNTESDLAGYRVVYGTQPGSTSVTVDVGNVTSHSLNSLQPGTYYFRVVAYNATGQSSLPSSEVSHVIAPPADTTPPGTVSSLAASAPSATQATLTWLAATDNVGVTGYRVERCAGAGCSAFAQVAAPATPGHTEGGLSASTTYRYRVRAVDAAGNAGPYSAVADVSTPAALDTARPTIPDSLTALALSTTEVRLTWLASADTVGVTGYRVERCTGTTCTNFKHVGTATTTSYVNSGLAASRTYRYRVRAFDAAGNLSGYSNIATVTTSSSTSTPCPCTIWPASATPDYSSFNDSKAVELGVKFQTSQAGVITGVRFYKGLGNTGTHIGSLWTASGTLLASATFVNETASGWQQVEFATPVAVMANTTYIASYHAPAGRYALNDMFFTTGGVSRGPLAAPSSTAVAGNGVYLYGGHAFPTKTYRGENYWVDVVFAPAASTSTSTTSTMTATGTSEPVVAALTSAPLTVEEGADGSRLATADATDTRERGFAGDEDADGLPSAWELTYGLLPTSASGDDGPSGDPDGDGLSNVAEYERGSHPRGSFARYLADGLVTSEASTRLVVTNAAAEPATIVLAFADAGGAVVRASVALAAGAAREVDVRALQPRVAGAFSVIAESDQPFTMEREIVWAATGAASRTQAVEAPAARWYFAYGSTRDPQELFYIVFNPGAQPVDVVVRYLRPDGAAPVLRTHTVAAGGRTTIWVDRDDPALAALDVSAEIASQDGNLPIVVERSLFTTGGGSAPLAVDTVMGRTDANASWSLTADDGCTSVAIANPSEARAVVQVTFATEGVRRDAGLHVIAAGSRITLDASGPVNGPLEIEVASATGTPIVAEVGGPR